MNQHQSIRIFHFTVQEGTTPHHKILTLLNGITSSFTRNFNYRQQSLSKPIYLNLFGQHSNLNQLV